MAQTLASGILIKTAEAFTPFAAADGSMSLTPLFESIGRDVGVLGVGGRGHWSRLSFDGERPADLWEACHRLTREGMAAVGLPRALFAEPDFVQAWPQESVAELARLAVAPCDQVRPPQSGLPSEADAFWFRAPDHSDFQSLADGQGARIVHLDTGFDPAHSTCPAGLDRARQRNFVDRERPNDATDTAGGGLANPGHGTATLALLASRAFGGAPGASVIPMRVADSVVLFSNSSIAKAMDEVHRLTVSGEAPVDVVTLSMGGLASQAWAEAVNALYDAGVFVVAAAGNNYANLPTRFIVYPARFDRVVAACGVMANHQPYADLAPNRMAGNYGPGHKMRTAMAAATPNLPWARLGCPQTVDRHGGGTSAATPQVAAAAARWIAARRADLEAYPEPWMRVEAVRRALFDSAKADAARERWLGRGELKADAALATAAPAPANLTKLSPDRADFAFLRVLTGLGVAPLDEEQRRMLELEALQIAQRSGLEMRLDKPPEALTAPEAAELAAAIAAQPEASPALRQALGAGPPTTPDLAPSDASSSDLMARYHLRRALRPEPPTPQRRRLMAYAYDPMLSGRLDGWGLNEAALQVRWEPLQPGPVGEYLEVVDVDPASGCAYAPVDLDDPRLLATDGLSPNEANPQFHQQMAYAVASKTVEHFERALGRVALWAPSFPEGPQSIERARFVPRLRIYPHALREENAYYSPAKSALLFGYFSARADGTGEIVPGGTVFSCLSHDIVAHETAHALLDGLHRYYREAATLDAMAFHEGFADLVALFQHFTVPEALKGEIARTRGDLGLANRLAELAVQFGRSTGRRGALRVAIGSYDAEGAWRRARPSPQDYAKALEPHDRGAVLVSAVFDGFLAVYQARSADLIRLATGGTGVLPPGAISADLVARLAQEAAQVAGEVLQMCIRALDYCPPVDLTFGDYLRALITADRDVTGDERREHRLALAAAFRARGVHPAEVRQLSAGAMVWEPPPIPLPVLERQLDALEDELNLKWSLGADRRTVWDSSRQAAQLLWRDLKRETPTAELAALGLQRRGGVEVEMAGRLGRLQHFEVHSVRPARRVDSEGQARTDLVVEITQGWSPKAAPNTVVRGGCTVLFDLEARSVRYLIRKRLDGEGYVERQLGARAAFAASPLRELYFEAADPAGEPFALLHRQEG